ncbi:MAG: hypothetical protein ACI81T_000402, partial [Bacteroidia bacterium]
LNRISCTISLEFLFARYNQVRKMLVGSLWCMQAMKKSGELFRQAFELKRKI